MRTDWYLLRVTDSDETLMRCDASGFATLPLRPTLGEESPRSQRRPSTPAATPEARSPYAPTDVGRRQPSETPRETEVTHDAHMEDDPTERYLRELGHAVDEAIRHDPAPLYVAMDPDRQVLFQTVGKTEVAGFVDDPHSPLRVLWKAVREREVKA